MTLSTLLANQNDFWTTTLPILRIILFIFIVLCAVVLIVAVLMQTTDADDGMGSITGSQESYYSQNKGSSREGKLKILTIVMACLIFLCVVLYFVTELINKKA